MHYGCGHWRLVGLRSLELLQCQEGEEARMACYQPWRRFYVSELWTLSSMGLICAGACCANATKMEYSQSFVDKENRS